MELKWTGLWNRPTTAQKCSFVETEPHRRFNAGMRDLLGSEHVRRLIDCLGTRWLFIDWDEKGELGGKRMMEHMDAPS